MVDKEQVIEALQTIRPFLQRDGGDVEFVDVDDNGVVYVRLLGACGGCPIATMTLKGLIESRLAEMVEGVTEVVEVE
ncbi:NifU family protein [Clostridiales bacterium COT073_COT-073]|nr:NifU family protein [Clostridiales bacterium COT073_COT-073]